MENRFFLPRIAWLLILCVVTLSAVTWFFREANPWLTWVVWAVAASVGIYSIVTAVLHRRVSLGVVGALVIPVDMIIFFIYFLGQLIFIEDPNL